jgi:hypothetical protein
MTYSPSAYSTHFQHFQTWGALKKGLPQWKYHWADSGEVGFLIIMPLLVMVMPLDAMERHPKRSMPTEHRCEANEKVDAIADAAETK